MNTINAHYEGIMAMLLTLIIFFGLACIAAFGLWCWYRIEAIWAHQVRRIKHKDVRVPGAFKQRPWRPM